MKSTIPVLKLTYNNLDDSAESFNIVSYDTTTYGSLMLVDANNSNNKTNSTSKISYVQLLYIDSFGTSMPIGGSYINIPNNTVNNTNDEDLAPVQHAAPMTLISTASVNSTINNATLNNLLNNNRYLYEALSNIISILRSDEVYRRLNINSISDNKTALENAYKAIKKVHIYDTAVNHETVDPDHSIINDTTDAPDPNTSEGSISPKIL